MKKIKKHHKLCTESDKPVNGCKVCEDLYKRYSVDNFETENTVVKVYGSGENFVVNRKK